MIIRGVSLTPALARWLRESHDDGQPELMVETTCIGRRTIGLLRGSRRLHPIMVIRIRRHDGTELSEAERLEIKARLAAHAVEPLK